jgi:hypothetical protein
VGLRRTWILDRCDRETIGRGAKGQGEGVWIWQLKGLFVEFLFMGLVGGILTGGR